MSSTCEMILDAVLGSKVRRVPLTGHPWKPFCRYASNPSVAMLRATDVLLRRVPFATAFRKADQSYKSRSPGAGFAAPLLASPVIFIIPGPMRGSASMAVSPAVSDQCTTGPAGAPFPLYLLAVHTSPTLASSLWPVKATHPFGHA